jgi:thioredoxin 1
MVSKIKSTDHFDWFIKEYPDRLIVVDFYAEWCMPCKQIAPLILKWAKETHTGVVFIKVDVDELPFLMETYNINMMPTFLFFKNHKIIHTIEGAYAQLINEFIIKNKQVLNSI